MYINNRRTLGANLKANGICDFRIWAPFLKQLMIEIISPNGRSYQYPMNKDEEGYFSATLKDIKAHSLYHYYMGDKIFPDLAADYLPQGINGPAEILLKSKVAPWKGHPLSSYIIYELHIGTYTVEGTFSAIIPYLPELKSLGITALEIMPVAQFSGTRNWGYDGVFPFAVQNTYGGPEGLKQLIEACHKLNLAVILDVVYNHIGPEGNNFGRFGPYFTDKYQTPWGKSLNFDDAYNHHVRNYFIENAIHWFIEYGVDALRLDALHAIVDNSAYPFLEELTDRIALLSVQEKKEYYLIAESSANDTRLIRKKNEYGFGIHAQWNDEFHHSLHTLLTNERDTYYQDYGTIDLFIKAYKEGYVYSGQYSIFHKKPHGISSRNLPAECFVVFMQNHDQIGNRAMGDRLTHKLSTKEIKFYAALLFFSPYIPLLFMGEEYAESAPFQYFVDHTDPELIKAVQKGRKREYYLIDEIPDAQSAKTFINSKLNHDLKKDKKHRQIWNFYQKLIHIRKTMPALSNLTKKGMELKLIQEKLLFITRKKDRQTLILIANFSTHTMNYSQYFEPDKWRLILSTTKNHSNREIAALGILIFEKGPTDE